MSSKLVKCAIFTDIISEQLASFVNNVSFKDIDIEKMTLEEIRKQDSKKWRQIRDTVFDKFKNKDTKLQHERRFTKAMALKNMNEILIGNRYQSA